MENFSSFNVSDNIGIDYCTFVIKETDIDTILNLLCNSTVLLKEHFNFVNGRLFAGCFGGYKLNDTNAITVNQSQDTNIGIIVDFKGKAFKYISEAELSRFYKNLKANNINFSISRIDLAYDDFTGKIIPVNGIIRECEKLMQPPKDWVRSVSTLYNPCSIKLYKHSFQRKSITNVSCGTQKSQVSFRLYNKAVEQKLSDVKWQRLELEIRHQKANDVALSLFGDIPLSIQEIYVNLLKKAFRPINVKSFAGSISRCSTAPYFQKFLDRILINSVSYYTF